MVWGGAFPLSPLPPADHRSIVNVYKIDEVDRLGLGLGVRVASF